MTIKEVIRLRLANQQITATACKTPQQLVGHMVAMQAQEFAMAKWAIGLRLPDVRMADVDNAFNNGDILRTHMMRPTWHFVAPADIKWMQQLTAHRVHAASASMYRKTGLDTKMFRRCNDLLVKKLQGGNFLTRDEIKAALQKSRIDTDGFRLVYLLMQAELECIICSGPRKGKQFTYALLDERAPQAITLDKTTALAELTRRYFSTRGPATVHDFVWWSGLTVKEAREGVALLDKELEAITAGDKEYIWLPAKAGLPAGAQATFLMPDYDEYGISYKDRSAIFNNEYTAEKRGGNIIFNHVIIVDGIVAGTWQPLKDKADAAPFAPLGPAKQRALDRALKRYADFIK